MTSSINSCWDKTTINILFGNDLMTFLHELISDTGFLPLFVYAFTGASLIESDVKASNSVSTSFDLFHDFKKFYWTVVVDSLKVSIQVINSAFVSIFRIHLMCILAIYCMILGFSVKH